MSDTPDEATVQALIHALTENSPHRSKGKDSMNKLRWAMLKQSPACTPRLLYNPMRWNGGVQCAPVPYRKAEWANFSE